MKTISKAHQKQIAETVAKLTEARTEIEEAVQALNEAIGTYNMALQDAAAIRNEIVASMEDHYDNRSEKWQASESGERYAEWKAEWEDIDMTEIDVVDDLELPHADDIEALNFSPAEE
jgi:seryl-tRNA synthetase